MPLEGKQLRLGLKLDWGIMLQQGEKRLERQKQSWPGWISPTNCVIYLLFKIWPLPNPLEVYTWVILKGLEIQNDFGYDPTISLITLETTLVTSSPPSTELKRCNLEIECRSFFNLNIIFDMCCVSTGKGVSHSIRHWSLFGECEKDGRYTIVTLHRWWDKDVCLVLQSSPQHIFRIAKFQNH